MSNNRSGDALRVAISGKSGCGNTTVSRLLAERLGIRFINYTFRTIAVEDGISFEDVCRRAEESDDDDRRVDENQVRMAREGSCVLGSRLAVWMLEEADLKVFLTGSPDVRAQRIREREGGDIRNHLESTLVRDRRDHDRYVRQYGIDNDDFEFADLVVNTDRLDAEQVTGIVEAGVREIVEKRNRARC